MGFAVSEGLVEAALSGAPETVERLLEAVWPDAYRLALAILGERQGAEDTAQEACVILYRSIASLRSPGAFRAWFYRIVVREANAFRRRRSRTEAVPDPVAPVDATAVIDVWRALAALPEHLRTVTVLRYFEGLPSREIASILQTSDGAVRFQLTMAKRRLRPLLDDRPTSIPNEVPTNVV